MPKLSVIIPIYNTEKYLRKCLDSVCNQTYKDLEIICVNDCSPDDSLKICKEYATKDSRIKIINREKNGGLSVARNSGLDNASGEYIYFIDSDDYIDLDYIEKMVEMIEKHSVDMVLNTHILAECGGKSQPFVWHRYKKKLPQGEFLPKEIAINNSLCTIYAHLYKKDFLDKYNLRFPEGYIHEDEYFQHTSKIHLNSLFTFYGPAYHYLQRQGSIMSSRKSKIEGYVKIWTLIYEFYKNNNLLHKDIAIKCFKINHFDTIKNEQEFALAKDYIELISKDFEKCPKASSHAEKYIFNAIKETNSFDEYRAKTGKNAFLTYMTREKMKQNNKGYKLSVIIPIYNTEKYIRKCLDSVCNQTLQDIEIICVNDCSPDNSLEILKEYASSDNRIKIIDFSQNKGAAIARNTAIDKAKGEYIGFVDSDDYIDLDFYEKLYERAKKDNADIAKSNLVCENHPTMNHNTIYHNIAEVQRNKLTLKHIPTTIIKKSLLDEYHILFPSDLKNAEDSVFEVMVAMYSNKIVIIESVFYHYEYNTSSLNNTAKYSLEKVKNILNSLQKIVAFLNLQDISQNTYHKLIIDRYDTIIDVIRKKFDGNLETLEYFESFSINLKQQLKYPLPSDNINKIHLLKKIAQSRKNTPKTSNSIIPKRIFYVWFGGKKSILANVCIDNWQEKLQDFEFVEINEDSPYFDFKSECKNCKWFREVYDRKLWAFASDYARIRVVYEYGGIYLDTDITIKKDLSPLLKHNFFIGEEEAGVLSAGVFGAIPNHPYLQAILDFYQKDIYKSPLYTIPQILTKVYGDNEFDDIYVYPPEFFYPFHYEESYSPQCVTPNTYTIHWWGASWVNASNLVFLQNKHLLATLRKRITK